MGNGRLMVRDRRLVVAGALLVQLCLGSSYARSVSVAPLQDPKGERELELRWKEARAVAAQGLRSGETALGEATVALDDSRSRVTNLVKLEFPLREIGLAAVETPRPRMRPFREDD